MRALLPTVVAACVRVYTPAYTPMARTVRAAARARRLLPRAERRDVLLRAAARAFARAGFVHTSMEEIAAAAGITRLIIYRHFASKEALYRAVLAKLYPQRAVRAALLWTETPDLMEISSPALDAGLASASSRREPA